MATENITHSSRETLRVLRLIESVLLIVHHALRAENTPVSACAAEVLRAHACHPLGIELDRLLKLA